jgi:hypothetical protein
LIATVAQKQRGEIAVRDKDMWRGRLKANMSVAQWCCADSPISPANGTFLIAVKLNQVRYQALQGFK